MFGRRKEAPKPGDVVEVDPFIRAAELDAALIKAALRTLTETAIHVPVSIMTHAVSPSGLWAYPIMDRMDRRDLWNSNFYPTDGFMHAGDLGMTP